MNTKNFCGFIEDVKKEIIRDIEYDGDETIDFILPAYNRYQEDERDGVDYIFDITKEEDVATMLKGGLSVTQLYNYLDKYHKGEVKNYCCFGANYTEITPVESISVTLVNALDEMLPVALLYAHKVAEYGMLYDEFVTQLIDHLVLYENRISKITK